MDNLQWMRNIAKEGDALRVMEPRLARPLGYRVNVPYRIDSLTSGWYWIGARGISIDLLLEWLKQGLVKLEHQ